VALGALIAFDRNLCYNLLMLKWLKKHFIPHEGNDYQPHFLRLKITAGLFALVLVVEAFYLAQTLIIFPKSDYFAAIFATVLIDQTNAQRVEGALHTLTPNTILEKAARLKAEDMAAKGYFAHDTPDGKTPWYWFEQAGYKYAAAGENLAVNFTDSTDVTNAWMQSPTHRANIMNGNYTEVGIATAEGVYKGRSAIFVVEEFGLPRQEVVHPAPVVAATPVVDPSLPVVKTVVTPAVSPKASAVPSALPVKTVTPTIVMNPPQTTTTPVSVVAGAETLAPAEITETMETTALPHEQVVPQNAPSVIATPERATLFASFITSPRHVATTFYALLVVLLLFVLGLAIFIEVRIQHAYIIWNGVLLVTFIIALIALNVTLGVGVGTVTG
jgi:uncharacterized protein YkwD